MTHSESPVADFVIHAPRPLPVFLLLDASGSMAENGKADALNLAVADMLSALAKEAAQRADIKVAALVFGSKVQSHLPLMSAAEAGNSWRPITAGGVTRMDDVFRLCREMMEDKALIPSRSYRPTLVLVSDGAPTDEAGRASDNWEAPLRDLLASSRGAKALRLAMAIGADADPKMLARFVANPETPVFSAAAARDIPKFFRYVTMSVVARTRSATPDKVSPLPLDDDEPIHY